jgi:hypothetical protein
MKISKPELIDLLSRFLDGQTDPWEWGDFTTSRFSDPAVEEVRDTCSDLPDLYPPIEKGAYCNAAGMQKLREIVEQLKMPRKLD